MSSFFLICEAISISVIQSRSKSFSELLRFLWQDCGGDFHHLTSAAPVLSMSNNQHRNFDTVSPLDSDSKRSLSQWNTSEDKKNSQVSVRPRTSSTSSSALSIKTPRTARFAEATSVNSPIDPRTTGRSPFADPPLTTQYLMPQPQPSDVGFGYMTDNQASKHSSFGGVEVPLTPNSPLKSALKPPGTPGRLANPLSPTFREEQILEKREEHTENQNAKDVV